MNLIRKIQLTLFLFMISGGAASAQLFQTAPFAGTPPFGTFGGDVDVINLGSMNVHLTIPILNKPGRGTNFVYNLTYDSSVWVPVYGTGGQVWEPVYNYGWTGAVANQLGAISNNETISTEGCYYRGVYRSGSATTFSSYQYHDALNIAHPYPGHTAIQHYLWCGTFSGFTATSPDGAGHSLTAGQYSNPVVSRAGEILFGPQNTYAGAGTKTDSNGNEITANSSGVFTDTLGTTVLTLGGTGTPSNPYTYSYSAPSGTATYTEKYTAYTVQTNFGCSGVAEYGPMSANLVSEIDLPDILANPTDKYTFTYEATPGYPGNVTGRLKSVTLPTGGTITYSYSGGRMGSSARTVPRPL
jgi:hypothetical protein